MKPVAFAFLYTPVPDICRKSIIFADRIQTHMKTELILVGKTVNKHFVAGINDYAERISHYMPFNIITIPELKNTKNLTEDQQKTAEGELILKQIQPQDTVVLLDERHAASNWLHGLNRNAIRPADSYSSLADRMDSLLLSISVLMNNCHSHASRSHTRWCVLCLQSNSIVPVPSSRASLITTNREHHPHTLHTRR